MFIKKSFVAGLALFGLAATNATAALSDDDYVEAAWMTTRFYGAQRSGEGPNWMADGTTYTTSFMKDTYNGQDVSGGWFDCGDHVMFGQTQGFGAYVLALAYAEFTEGFYDLYTGDYTDYKASGDYSRAGGKPNKVRDLLEELRYEADFWVKAAPSETDFVAVKGNGDVDHKNWVTPGKMSTMGTEEGGDPRIMQANTDDAFTSGMVAAFMAVMARVEPDAERQVKYLTAAKNAYAYSKAHKGVTTSGNYYNSGWWDGRTDDGTFLGALELYRTTKDESYKTEAQQHFSKLKFESGSYSRLNYANAVPLSVVMGEGVFGWKPAAGNAKDAKSFLDGIYKNQSDANGIFTKETGGGGSFSVRTPSGGAFLYGLYSKFTGSSDYEALIEKNVAYLLGDNDNKKSYVAGFDRNGAKAPTAVHHRGYYANEDPSKNPDSGLQPPAKNKYFGAMIAGAFSNTSHNDKVGSWDENEVCVDINAPMVGALGYILSKKAPKGDSELGVAIPGDVPKDTSVTDSTSTAVRALSSLAGDFKIGMNRGILAVSGYVPFTVEVFDLKGNLVQRQRSQGGQVNMQLKTRGVLNVRIKSKGAEVNRKLNNL